MADPTYPLFPVITFIAFIIALIPLPWHLQAWNSGTCYLMMWISLACLNQFVNSVVWASNMINHSPIWCDISIRIILASSVGIPASSLCINRRLFCIVSGQASSFGRREKLRAVLVDTLICVLFPLIFVALQYIVQAHRFDIFEDIGCYPALFNTPLTYVLTNTWPIMIGLISTVYCILSLRAFFQRRLQFSQFVNKTSSSLTLGRYFRLMALSMIDVLLTTPLAIFSIWINATSSRPRPWISWEDTHFEYFRVHQYPAVLWRILHSDALMMEFTRWVTPLSAFIFFAFFGFAEEARKNYSKIFSWLARPFHSSSWKDSLKGPSYPWTSKQPIIRLTSSSPPPSLLPVYSPPSSNMYRTLDIKRSSSDLPFTEEAKHDDILAGACKIEPNSPTAYGESCTTNRLSQEKDTELDIDDTFDMTTICQTTTPLSKDHSSWKTILVPDTERRHSSYF